MPGLFCAIALAAVPGLAAAECKVTNYGALPVEVVGQRATTMAKINGQDTRFILDTGATFGFMARANVEAMGLRREAAPFGLRMGGIGGSLSPDLTRVKSFGILNGTLSNIEFLVGGSDAGTGLIGANLLDVVDADVDLASGRFALLKPVGCEKLAMAYWTKDGQYSQTDLHPAGNTFDRRSFVTVTINGHPVRAMLDSGAMATVITRRAAERSGVDMSAAGSETAMRSRGVGSRTQKAWVVPVESYSIGEETVHHGKLEVIDDVMGEGPDAPDMLLGIDFFLSHHIFIANSQRKLYFTYNGGRVFTMGSVPKGAAQAAAATSDDEPKTAAAFALRGQARLSRGEGALALADLEQAVSLDGNVAAYRLARARARLAAGKAGGADPVGAALADLDAALRLDAQNLDALLLRAQLRFARKDR
ncbi:MAG TPA: retropepsin-like aspartic protease, partial [Novosphingobium sp.]|nr:retropepsin-like aspartic protease [Novosphingobium sp.]